MAGDEEHADVIGTGATGHGLPTQEHRGRERVHTTSARPRTRLEDAVGVGAAMASGVKHVDARGLGSTGHETRK